MRNTAEPGVSRDEFIVLAEFLNELDAIERDMFGNAVNAAIVRNVKAAHLKGSQVSIRGLARVLDLQPSTVRRRVAQLVEAGWITREDDRLRYAEGAMHRATPMVRRVLARVGVVVQRLGWSNPRPPG